MPTPRTARSTALALALVLALIAALASPSFAGRDDQLREKRENVNQDLRRAERHLDHSSKELIASARALSRAQAKLDTARAHLADTRGQLAVAIERDEQMQAALDAAEARLAAAKQALKDGRRQVKDAKDQLAAFVVSSYQYGNPTLVSLGAVLTAGGTSDLSERLSVMESVAGAQSATVDHLSATETLLTVRQEEVADSRDEVAEHRAEAAKNLEVRQQLEAEAQREAESVRALVEERRVAKLRADRAKQQDLRQIAQLERERERIKRMLQRLARQRPGPSVSVPEAGGFLSMPVGNTYVTSSYGMRLHPILRIVKLHDGTDFGAGCDVPVYASAAGRVVSQYYDGGYGNRVIISHGRVNGTNLATSYNHLSQAVASSGSHVQRGQLIGYAGTTGYSTGCHLHFMVYENGVTVDPMGWL